MFQGLSKYQPVADTVRCSFMIIWWNGVFIFFSMSFNRKPWISNQTTRRRRRVWNKDDVPRMASADAPHASVAPPPAAPATPQGDEKITRITPKSRDLVRRMLQEEHLGFQFIVNMKIFRMMRMIMMMIWMFYLCFSG